MLIKKKRPARKASGDTNKVLALGHSFVRSDLERLIRSEERNRGLTG